MNDRQIYFDEIDYFTQNYKNLNLFNVELLKFIIEYNKKILSSNRISNNYINYNSECISHLQNINEIYSEFVNGILFIMKSENLYSDIESLKLFSNKINDRFIKNSYYNILNNLNKLLIYRKLFLNMSFRQEYILRNELILGDEIYNL